MISLKLTFNHLKNLNQLVTEERLGEILARLILIDSDYCIPVYFVGEIVSQKRSKISCERIFSQITHVDKRKVWHGDTFVKFIL